MKKILLIGFNDADNDRFAGLIESNFDAEVVRLSTVLEAEKLMKNKFDLVIVSRIGAFDGRRGFEFVKYVKVEKIDVDVMLISDYEEYIKESVDKNAVEGFGKKMSDDEIVKILSMQLK